MRKLDLQRSVWGLRIRIRLLSDPVPGDPSTPDPTGSRFATLHSPQNWEKYIIRTGTPLQCNSLFTLYQPNCKKWKVQTDQSVWPEKKMLIIWNNVSKLYVFSPIHMKMSKVFCFCRGPSSISRAYQTKYIQPGLPNQIYIAGPTKPNIYSRAYLTKHIQSGLPNRTYTAGPT